MSASLGTAWAVRRKSDGAWYRPSGQSHVRWGAAPAALPDRGVMSRAITSDIKSRNAYRKRMLDLKRAAWELTREVDRDDYELIEVNLTPVSGNSAPGA